MILFISMNFQKKIDKAIKKSYNISCMKKYTYQYLEDDKK